MSDPGKRLDVALRSLQPADWDDFERLCGTFLSADFPDLRTIGGVGDRGRDAVLESPEHPGVVLQFSIEQDVRAKIVKTVSRLREAGVVVNTLVFATNQAVGTRSDAIEAELLNMGIGLLIRDRRWFVDRAMSSPARRTAAEALAARVVDPIAIAPPAYGVGPLDDAALRAGLLYLELQLKDAEGGRNLTKMTFDGLVLSVLSGTDPEHRLTRAEILARVCSMVPNQAKSRVEAAVQGSLTRLRSRRKIVYTARDESFALHHTERVRLAERVAEIADVRTAVFGQLAGMAASVVEDLEIPLSGEVPQSVLDVADSTMQRVLEDQGNEFAEAVRTRGATLRRRDLYSTAETVVTAQSSRLRSLRVPLKAIAELVAEIVTRSFVVPTGPLQAYMREMADAYSLLAFMREAEDVNQAVSHFFGKGTLVLDATAILPVIPETAIDREDQRFSNLFRAANVAGLKLRVSEGVLNEILTHFRRCLACLQTPPSEWQGSIPLVLAEWRALSAGCDFRSFINDFTSKDDSTERVEMFLREEFGIETIELDEWADRIPVETRGRITEIWRPRKRIRPTETEIQRDILLRHDVSMYCGVLGMRQEEDRTDIRGYESWWVTADGTGFKMRGLLKDEGIELDSDPCMSAAFLANLLALGPSAARMSSDARMSLPAALDVQRWAYVGGELAKAADDIRASQERNPEWLIRSKTREAMSAFKQTRSEIAAPEADARFQDDPEDLVDSEG